MLAVHIEGLTAGRENSRVRARTEQRVDLVGDLVEHMLTIVDHQQHALGADAVTHLFVDRGARIGNEIDRVRERLGDRVVITHPGQINEERPVRERDTLTGRDLDRESGLPTPARAGQRDEPARVEQRAGPVDLVVSTHEAGPLRRQRALDIGERPNRRELACEAITGELKQMLGTIDVAQPVLTEIDEPHARAVEHPRRCAGHEDLRAVRRRHHPRAPIQRRTEVIAVPFDRFSCVDTHRGPAARSHQANALPAVLAGRPSPHPQPTRPDRTRPRTRHRQSRTRNRRAH